MSDVTGARAGAIRQLVLDFFEDFHREREWNRLATLRGYINGRRVPPPFVERVLRAVQYAWSAMRNE